jgi:polysaccharide biosynthesis protein PslG
MKRASVRAGGDVKKSTEAASGSVHTLAAFMSRLVALVIVLIALLAAPAGAAERRVPQGWLGASADGPLSATDDAEWDRMARTGVETVRVAFRWYLLQPEPQALDFASTDAFVAAAARRGIGVLPVVEQPPAWAATRPGDLSSPPRDPAAVQAFLAALVGRYGPVGTFWAEHPELPRLTIRAWQIWNEPNHRGVWSEQPYAPSYVRTLRAAAAGVRGADPGAKVVLAGLVNRSWLALRELYRAGAHGLFDAVAIHPYTAKPRNVVRLVELARKEMRRRGDGKLPIWITELSWPAAKTRSAKGKVRRWFGFEVTPAGQALRLGRALALLSAARERLRIGHVSWYTWLSSETGPSSFDWSGLRRVRNGRAVSTPTLFVFRRAARRLEGCAKGRDALRCA